MLNDPNIPLSDNVEKFMNSFTNWSIVVERGLRSMVRDFEIDTIFDYMGWQNLFHLKNPTYLKLIRMFFFANMQINMKHRIASHLQNIRIELDCDTLGNILGISSEGYMVYEVNIIPIIGDFVYDEVVT